MMAAAEAEASEIAFPQACDQPEEVVPAAATEDAGALEAEEPEEASEAATGTNRCHLQISGCALGTR
jgi:hypothetical protein